VCGDREEERSKKLAPLPTALLKKINKHMAADSVVTNPAMMEWKAGERPEWPQFQQNGA
jgi:hypothetical protein